MAQLKGQATAKYANERVVTRRIVSQLISANFDAILQFFFFDSMICNWRMISMGKSTTVGGELLVNASLTFYWHVSGDCFVVLFNQRIVH